MRLHVCHSVKLIKFFPVSGNVNFLCVFVRNYRMDFRFSGNNRNIECTLRRDEV